MTCRCPECGVMLDNEKFAHGVHFSRRYYLNADGSEVQPRRPDWYYTLFRNGRLLQGHGGPYPIRAAAEAATQMARAAELLSEAEGLEVPHDDAD